MFIGFNEPCRHRAQNFIFIVFFFFWYSTNQGLESAVPVLLVDGYNVCGYWPKLKKHFMKGRLDVARQKLLDELIGFSVLKGLPYPYSSYFS